MTIGEFERLLLLHGPDVSRWPTATAEAASKLMEADETARALVAEMTSLELRMGALAAAEPVGSGAVGQIVAMVEHRRGGIGASMTAWRLTATGAALAASVAGFAIGYFEETRSSIDDAMSVDAGLETGGVDIWSLL